MALVRTLFVFIGVVVVFLVLASTGTVTGDVCVNKVGCLHATGTGFQLDGDQNRLISRP